MADGTKKEEWRSLGDLPPPNFVALNRRSRPVDEPDDDDPTEPNGTKIPSVPFTPPPMEAPFQENLTMPDPSITPTPGSDQQKSWIPTIAAVIVLISVAGFVGGGWWSHVQDDGKTEPVATEATSINEDIDPATMTEAQEQTAPAAADPTNCTFVDDNRPQVGEKFILQCADGQYLAIGTYNGENFDWSGFEEYPQPK